MAGNLQPLDEKFPIVGPDGRPTLYFIKWCQQRQIDITEALTLLGLEEYLADHKLQEGSGIQFNPDGNLANSPIISADAQEILDQITSTRGSILYRGLLGWAALAPGTSGDFLKTNGAGADPLWAAAGGGGSGHPWYWAPPLAADFPVNFTSSGTAVVKTDDADLGLTIRSGNASDATFRTRGIAKALPAGAFDVKCHLTGDIYLSNYNGFGLYLFETGTNKIYGSTLTFDTNMYFDTWYGTISSFVTRGARYLANETSAFFRVTYDGVNTLKLFYSINGKNWLEIASIAKTTPFTAGPTHVGLAITQQNALTSSNQQLAACDYWSQSF